MKYWDYLKYSGRLFWKSDMLPLYLIHFVTSDCVARCKHCLLGERGSSRSKDLTIDEIERTVKNTKPLLFVFLTGGEPFLREDLYEIARIYYQIGRVRKMQIPTNGWFGERIFNFAQNISKACPDMHVGITVSLDGIGSDHDEIRGLPGLFVKATETFTGLKYITQKLPNVDVNCTITVSSYNQHKLLLLADFIVNNLHCENLFNSLVRGKPRDPTSLHIDIRNYETLNSWLEKAYRRDHIAGYKNFPFAGMVNAKNLMSRKIIVDIAKGRKNSWMRCYAGTLSGVLMSDGSVYPCELRNELYGGVRDNGYNLQELWRSKKAKEIRLRIRRENCSCTHECFISHNLLFSTKGLFMICINYMLSGMR